MCRPQAAAGLQGRCRISAGPAELCPPASLPLQCGPSDCTCALRMCPVQALASRTTKPLVVVLVHNGPIDVSELQASPRVAAILSAW